MSLPRRSFYRLFLILATLGIALVGSGGRTLVSDGKLACYPQYAPVTALAFSPDNQLLAIGDAWGGLRLQPLTNNLLCRFLRGHEGPIEALAFHPNGSLLATTSQDGTVRLWSTLRNTELSCALPCSHDPRCLAFTPDGRWLAVGYEDGSVWTWDHDAARPGPVFRVAESAVLSVAFAPDRSTMAVLTAGSSDIGLWDTTTRTRRSLFQCHGHAPRTMVFSPDGREILGVSVNTGSVSRWRVATGEHLETIAMQSECNEGLILSADARTVVAAGSDRMIRVRELQDHQSEQLLHSSTTGCHRLAVADDGQVIAGVGTDQVVRVWHRADGVGRPRPATIPAESASSVRRLAMSEASSTAQSGLPGAGRAAVRRDDTPGPLCARGAGTRCP